MAFDWLDPTWVFTVLEVVVGLGMVIFVHELGHFVVAKLCGVKCEKFYLGFDIGGLKLWKHRWGETEYGIGILPLGGYVKMLGQEDNPARFREEMERAKLAQAQQTQPAPAAAPNSTGETAGSVPAGSPASPAFDPRSYLAQSVPKRMAIISAGVVMNVLFAVLTGAVAYRLGFFEVSCGVGGVIPGAAAWQLNFRVGDRITRIGDKPVQDFIDLKSTMTVGDVDAGVTVEIERPGVAKPFTVTVLPNQTGSVPTIGIVPPYGTQLYEKFPAVPGSPAARALPPLQAPYRVVRIGEGPVARFADVHRQLALHPDKPLSVTLERVASPAGKQSQGSSPPPPERIEVRVAPAAMRILGLKMPMGPITLIQADSPAAKAGLQPGDLITALDGEPIDDAMRLPEQLRVRALAAGKVTLTIQRKGAEKAIQVEVPLRRADWYEIPLIRGNPLSSPALGIAYQVPNRIAGLVPGSPAAGAEEGLKPGDVIAKAEILPPNPKTVQDPELAKFIKKLSDRAVAIDFAEEPNGWPSFFYGIQEALPGSQVKLTLSDGQTCVLEPADATDWYFPERGFFFRLDEFFVRADSWASALKLGADKTVESMTLVFQFLRKIRSRARLIGGPFTIFDIAYQHAAEGPAKLFLFLTIIGANLAVLNFLPIPVLDGGHFVFLSYEAVTGKPPNERVQLWLSYAGLLVIVGLMVWALGLDLKVIPRH